ncbi:HD domain-containing protein [Nocardiopsis changdeensis]|uniref:HD domain-containing protein n=1 Tax=Nocardiopsis changdeensis TaxID=2831969 RepID=A0ABX8BND4_9ACTN|nr:MULTISPECIES: HD domain-containing protein [Nocardiopsis]QUX22799.1 HD domain-containing protein [Nocardiopsis changdeensis]QYX38741.1 HD domain-containing protein [Nocardiopsis sp. MT53]
MDTYGDLPFPRTGLALDALRLARDTESPAIFNHSMRSYLYGRFLGERQGLRPGHDYDDELLFLGCVLHDIGLTPHGDRGGRFDIDGADTAAAFLHDRGVAADRVEVVWDAVALHLCFDVAIRKRPEIALVTAGAGYDLGPEGPALPEGYADRVHAVLPRLRAAAALHDAIVDQALADPGKAPPFSTPGELLRQHTGERWPTWRELMSGEAGWGDYAGI